MLKIHQGCDTEHNMKLCTWPFIRNSVNLWHSFFFQKMSFYFELCCFILAKTTKTVVAKGTVLQFNCFTVFLTRSCNVELTSMISFHRFWDFKNFNASLQLSSSTWLKRYCYFYTWYHLFESIISERRYYILNMFSGFFLNNWYHIMK